MRPRAELFRYFDFHTNKLQIGSWCFSTEGGTIDLILVGDNIYAIALLNSHKGIDRKLIGLFEPAETVGTTIHRATLQGKIIKASNGRKSCLPGIVLLVSATLTGKCNDNHHNQEAADRSVAYHFSHSAFSNSRHTASKIVINFGYILTIHHLFYAFLTIRVALSAKELEKQVIHILSFWLITKYENLPIFFIIFL